MSTEKVVPKVESADLPLLPPVEQPGGDTEKVAVNEESVDVPPPLPCNNLADSINKEEAGLAVEEGGPKNDNNETKRVIKSFAQRIEDLRAYKAKHGHTNLKEKEDKSLYLFCCNMRHARKHPGKSRVAVLINEERIASLDALGFDWAVKEHAEKKSFAQRIEDLQEYKEKYGHIRVKQSEDKSLYKFCSKMRYTRKKPEKSNMAINEERIASLDALGFDWKVNERQAGKSAAKQTNLQVPNNSSSQSKTTSQSDAPSKRKQLDDEKIQKPPQKKRIRQQATSGRGRAERKSFEQRLDDLRAYKEKHGHINVKYSEEGSEDKKLYDFCKHMRRARKNPEKATSVLTDDRMASLDALGFNWTVKEQVAKKSFEQRVEDLRAYKEEHGHTNVKEREDKSLHNFCYNIRYARKHPDARGIKLNADRIQCVDALGFDWSIKERKGTAGPREQAARKSFEQRIEDLRAYKEEHGHVNVTGNEDKSLYLFCSNMRQARNNPGKSNNMLIDEERISSLDALGFDWKMS